MKVELLIADDRELRAAVHELIRSEVLSIARGEIRGIIAEVVGGNVAKHEERIEALFKSEVREAIKPMLEGRGYGNTSVLTEMVRAEVRQIMAEWWKSRPPVV